MLINSFISMSVLTESGRNISIIIVAVLVLLLLLIIVLIVPYLLYRSRRKKDKKTGTHVDSVHVNLLKIY